MRHETGGVVPLSVQIALGASHLIVALVQGVIAHRGARGKLPRNHWIGFRGARSLSSESAWIHVHRRAAPLTWVSSAVAFFAGSAIILLDGSNEWMILATTLVAAFAIIILMIMAWKVGHQGLPGS
ncbi:SdpI family protein [Pseudonocardia sp. ICBG1142]|uniref:SdpI family protein n=1 Tax=Pseudonocardia sp. ICBG1142 TaxID=2846760 RepID=UPI001CF69C70